MGIGPKQCQHRLHMTVEKGHMLSMGGPESTATQDATVSVVGAFAQPLEKMNVVLWR